MLDVPDSPVRMNAGKKLILHVVVLIRGFTGFGPNLLIFKKKGFPFVLFFHKELLVVVVVVQRNSIQAASNFVNRNRLPPRLKDQILAYMCLRFKAESLNQQHVIDQLPKSIHKSICQHLFLPSVEKVYLFKGVSREILLLLVSYITKLTRVCG